jgi:hypothetical protein
LEWLGEILKPVGRLLAWLFSFVPGGPIALILLWSVIGIGAAAALWAAYNFIRHGEFRLRGPRSVAAVPLDIGEEWRPEIAGAKSWLEEADALARDGRFAEAIHLLLFRSIEDISSRRPALVRPALTSREIAASHGIPEQARNLFAGIARLVERSLFGGSAVSEVDWQQARRAYSDFALPTAWHA